MSSHSPPLVARAHDEAVAECRRLEAEIIGFEQFVDRIRGLPVASQVTDGGTALQRAPRTVAATGDAARFRAFRRAYRDTVLSVPHWQNAYQESTVAESLAAEFSPAIANLIAQPGTAKFTPALRTHLIEAGTRAVAMRQRTLAYLDAEVAELERLRAELEPVADRLSAVRTGRGPFETRVDQVRHAQRTLDRLLETHQTYIHERPRRRYDPLLASVYAGLDVDHPGLAAIADAIGRVHRVELRLWAGLYANEQAPANSGSP